jgi:transposase-like protein
MDGGDARGSSYCFSRTIKSFSAKYPKAMKCLTDSKEELLAFYDFPAEHWTHIRTTNPIESTFATLRLRTKSTRGCGSRDTTLAMVYKLIESAQKRWKRIKGFALLTLVVSNVEFKSRGSIRERCQCCLNCTPDLAITRFRHVRKMT